jgi:hypothetical protein
MFNRSSSAHILQEYQRTIMKSPPLQYRQKPLYYFTNDNCTPPAPKLLRGTGSAITYFTLNGTNGSKLFSVHVNPLAVVSILLQRHLVLRAFGLGLRSFRAFVSFLMLEVFLSFFPLVFSSSILSPSV